MYAKVYASLWDGTLYGKTDAQLVFIFLLARCNAEGYVRCVPEAIASPTGLALARVLEALALLEAADPDSNSKESDGARLERVETAGSWRIINYAKYRTMKDADTVRFQTLKRVQKHRLKRSVTHGNARKRQAEAEVEVEVKENNTHPKGPPAENGTAESLSVDEWFETYFWPKYPRREKKPLAARAMRSVFKSVPRGSEGEDRLAEAILSGLTRYCELVAGKEREFISHPATWINNRRWEDET